MVHLPKSDRVRFKCYHCGKEFSNKNNLNSHLKTLVFRPIKLVDSWFSLTRNDDPMVDQKIYSVTENLHPSNEREDEQFLNKLSPASDSGY